MSLVDNLTGKFSLKYKFHWDSWYTYDSVDRADVLFLLKGSLIQAASHRRLLSSILDFTPSMFSNQWTEALRVKKSNRCYWHLVIREGRTMSAVFCCIEWWVVSSRGYSNQSNGNCYTKSNCTIGSMMFNTKITLCANYYPDPGKGVRLICVRH